MKTPCELMQEQVGKTFLKDNPLLNFWKPDGKKSSQTMFLKLKFFWPIII